MSKQPIPDRGSFDEELPPPYTERANENNFSSHLSNLQENISSKSSSTDDDSHILAALVDPIDTFVTQISNLRPAPKIVEGIFIPSEAVSLDWTLSDEGEQHRGELIKTIRVNTQPKEDHKPTKETPSRNQEDSSSSSQTKEFDDWGRWDEPSSIANTEETLWWTDEDLALRLARRIQPTSLQGMDVRAERVTFRRETELGIWESKSGWGVVVRLKL